jgi:hypothetical protein
MVERKQHGPQFSIPIEPGKWYWGTVCPKCGRQLAIEPADIEAEAPYPDQAGIFSIWCILCRYDDNYPAHTIKSFRGE